MAISDVQVCSCAITVALEFPCSPDDEGSLVFVCLLFVCGKGLYPEMSGITPGAAQGTRGQARV